MKTPHTIRILARFGLMAALLAPLALRADDVTDAIDEGTQFYKQGKFAEAASSFDYAAQLIRQKRGGEFVKLLPNALDGWTAEDAESTATGAALMGGMVSAERNYNKKNDDNGANVTITITGDSPALQSYVMMLTNPMIASSSGGKLKTISGQRALVKYDTDDKSGEITAVINSKYLISVKGNNVTADDLTNYFKAIDFDAVSKL